MSYAPNAIHQPAEWTIRGTCTQPPYAGSDLWYADEWQKDDRRTAISLCRTCPVLDACRATAAKEEAGKAKTHRHGIRAAMTPRQRWLAEQRSREQAEARPACGTTKAYYQHLAVGEPACDACQAASDAYEQQLATTSQNGQR